MATTITQNPSPTGLTDITGLMNLLTGQYGAGVTQRKKQYEEGLGRLEQALTTAQGPEFDQLALEQYGRAKTKAVSSGLSRLISSGLMGTTRAAEPERAFEAEVGAPFYKGLAEAKAGRISSALGNISQYQMQFPNIYPEAGTLAYLATGGFGMLSPQQKMAMEELPTLAGLAIRTPTGGTGFMQSATGGGGGGGGGTTWENQWGSTGTPSSISGGGGGGGGWASPAMGAGGGGGGYEEGTSWFGPDAPGGTGSATYTGGQWVSQTPEMNPYPAGKTGPIESASTQAGYLTGGNTMWGATAPTATGANTPYSAVGQFGVGGTMATMADVLKKHPNAVQTGAHSFGVPSGGGGGSYSPTTYYQGANIGGF